MSAGFQKIIELIFSSLKLKVDKITCTGVEQNNVEYDKRNGKRKCNIFNSISQILKEQTFSKKIKVKKKRQGQSIKSGYQQANITNIQFPVRPCKQFLKYDLGIPKIQRPEENPNQCHQEKGQKVVEQIIFFGYQAKSPFNCQ